MKQDLFAIKIVENGASTDEKISPLRIIVTSYVFYDYVQRVFVLRAVAGKKSKFSCHAKDKDVILDLALEFLTHYNLVEVSLVCFPEAPMESDDITFDFLSENDENHNEISGYNLSNGNGNDDEDEDEEEEESFPYKEIKRLLGIIEGTRPLPPTSTSQNSCVAHNPRNTGGDRCPVFLYCPYFYSQDTRPSQSLAPWFYKCNPPN